MIDRRQRKEIRTKEIFHSERKICTNKTFTKKQVFTDKSLQGLLLT